MLFLPPFFKMNQKNLNRNLNPFSWEQVFMAFLPLFFRRCRMNLNLRFPFLVRILVLFVIFKLIQNLTMNQMMNPSYFF